MASTPIGHHSSESGTVPVACEATSLLWQESNGSTATLDFSIVAFVPKILSSVDKLFEVWHPLSHSLAQRLWVLEKDKPRIPLRRNETSQSRSQKISIVAFLGDCPSSCSFQSLSGKVVAEQNGDWYWGGGWQLGCPALSQLLMSGEGSQPGWQG